MPDEQDFDDYVADQLEKFIADRLEKRYGRIISDADLAWLANKGLELRKGQRWNQHVVQKARPVLKRLRGG